MPCPRAEIRALLHAFGIAAALGGAGAWAAGCDAGPHAPDAQTPVSARSAELSIRFDVSSSKPPAVSVLGFRATTAGPEAPDVLGLVDPLSAAAPDQGCSLRDVDEASSALTAHGSSIDLEELTGVGVGFGPNDPLVRPFPRVFPDVAGVVGGVVAEAGPQTLAALPERLSIYSADDELPIADLSVPAPPRLLAVNGTVPVAGAQVDVARGLSLSLADAAGALIELRPFGATVAVACTVPRSASTEALIVVPRALLAHLSRAVSIEVVRRTQVHEPLPPAGGRVSVEVRSAVPVELRP